MRICQTRQPTDGTHSSEDAPEDNGRCYEDSLDNVGTVSLAACSGVR